MRGTSFLQLFFSLLKTCFKEQGWVMGRQREQGRKKVGFFVAFHFSEQTCCTSWLSPSWTPPVCPWPQPWKHWDQGGVQPSRQWASQSTISWLTLNPFLMVGTAVERLLLFFPKLFYLLTQPAVLYSRAILSYPRLRNCNFSYVFFTSISLWLITRHKLTQKCLPSIFLYWKQKEESSTYACELKFPK